LIERLQKLIARAGVASRRAAEELVTSGRVRVNGRVVSELGAKADARNDKIEVDGRVLLFEAPIYLVLHKPRGVVSTMSDPEGRPTVADLVKSAPARVYPVGRLDFATSGVLLMTNDGEFANGLLHPRGGVPKTYVLKVSGSMTEEDAEKWRTGVELEDGKTLPAEVRIVRHEEDKTWIEITLREGRNQQIRRMGEATGFRVMRLARLEFAGVNSERLRPGEWRPLSHDELLAIRKQFGVPRNVRRSSNAGVVPEREGGRRPTTRAHANAPAAAPGRGERRERAERGGGPGHGGRAGASHESRPGPGHGGRAGTSQEGRPAAGHGGRAGASHEGRPAAGHSGRAGASHEGRPSAGQGGRPSTTRAGRPSAGPQGRSGPAPVTPARSDRSGTKPRGAARPGSPARGRAGR
jgi:23S rRNA pseudouridine2605 synthase